MATKEIPQKQENSIVTLKFWYLVGPSHLYSNQFKRYSCSSIEVLVHSYIGTFYPNYNKSWTHHARLKFYDVTLRLFERLLHRTERVLQCRINFVRVFKRLQFFFIKSCKLDNVMPFIPEVVDIGAYYGK